MRRRPPESNRTAPLVPDTTPFRSPTPSEETRRRAFEGLRKRTPSPAMDARARAALDKSKEAMAQEREAMSRRLGQVLGLDAPDMRSEEHTSELQSLMRISYAVFCFKKKQQLHRHTQHKY